MNAYNSIENAFNRLGRSRALSARNFQYSCAVSGVLCAFFFFFSWVAASLLPPIKPYWTAEQTVNHYQHHIKGTQTGAALMILSGMFYLPLTAAISAQMRRIPNLHYTVPALQLASGAAGVFTFMVPAMLLGSITFRLERDPQITQALNDVFWIMAFMPVPTFMLQALVFAYAIIVDTRPNPVFPKFMAMVNLAVPVLFVPTLAVHTAKTGPLAWNGGLTFWTAGVSFVLELVIDSLCLFRAISTEATEVAKSVGNGLEDSSLQEHEAKV